MLVRYLVEYALRTDPQTLAASYVPIGVWAHGERTGFDLAYRYVPGNTWAEERAERIINAMIEAGRRALPTGFMESYSVSLYQGDVSALYATTRYATPDEVAEAVLGLLTRAVRLSDPPLPPS